MDSSFIGCIDLMKVNQWNFFKTNMIVVKVLLNNSNRIGGVSVREYEFQYRLTSFIKNKSELLIAELIGAF